MAVRVPRLMAPVIRDRSQMVSPEFPNIRGPRLASLGNPPRYDLVSRAASLSRPDDNLWDQLTGHASKYLLIHATRLALMPPSRPKQEVSRSAAVERPRVNWPCCISSAAASRTGVWVTGAVHERCAIWFARQAHSRLRTSIAAALTRTRTIMARKPVECRRNPDKRILPARRQPKAASGNGRLAGAT
jgi:hypothetical protein